MILQTASSRWLAGIAIAVVALVVASIVLVIVNRQGEPELFPPESPEGVVQRFLLAVEDRQDREAYGYLGAGLAERCDFDLFRDSVRNLQRDGSRGEQDLRVSLSGVETVDGAVEVSVRVTRYRVDPPFGGDEYSSRRVYVLEKLDGVWRFTEPPWPLDWCPKPEELDTGKPEAGSGLIPARVGG